MCVAFRILIFVGQCHARFHRTFTRLYSKWRYFRVDNNEREKMRFSRNDDTFRNVQTRHSDGTAISLFFLRDTLSPYRPPSPSERTHERNSRDTRELVTITTATDRGLKVPAFAVSRRDRSGRVMNTYKFISKSLRGGNRSYIIYGRSHREKHALYYARITTAVRMRVYTKKIV